MAKVHLALGPKVAKWALMACLGGGVVAGLVPSRASAYCRSSTETEPSGLCSEGPDAILLFWGRSCLDMSFHASIFERLQELSESEVRGIVQGSFDTWMDVECDSGNPFRVAMTDGVTDAEPVEFVFDAPNTAVFSAQTRQEWAELEQPPSAFAITFLWHNKRTGEIYDVDMALNLRHAPFVDCGESASGCPAGDVDLQNTVTHEAGHVFGLGHSDVPMATMQFDARAGEVFMRDLESDDEDGLCSLMLPAHSCAGSGCTCPAPPVIPSVMRTESGCSVSSPGGAGGEGGCTLVSRGANAGAQGSLADRGAAAVPALGTLGMLVLFRRRRRQRSASSGRRTPPLC